MKITYPFHRIAAAIAALSTVQGVLAQSTDAAAAPATAASAPEKSVEAREAVRLDAVVITAQKKSERARDVPSSVAVLSGLKLEREGASRLEDYVARVPGLVLNAQALGQQQITIRGLSTGAQGTPTAAVYIDDAPAGASTGSGPGGLILPDVDVIDLERVEVLRGPQGTLYGASNIGGLLKYVTVSPDLDDMSGEVGAEANTRSHGGNGHAVRARVNVPIIKNELGVLVSAYDRRDPGFIGDDGRGRKEVDEATVRGGRLTALWKLSPRLSIKGTVLGQDRSTQGFAQFDADPMTLAPVYGLYQQRRAEGADYAKSKTRQNMLTVNYDFDDVKLTAVTGYSKLTHWGGQDYTQTFGPIAGTFSEAFNGVPRLGFTATDVITLSKINQEVRLTGRAGALNWMAGVFYTRETTRSILGLPALDSASGALKSGLPSLLDYDIGASYKEYAGFGQATYSFSPNFDLTAGVRHAQNKQTNVSTGSGLLVGPGSTTVSDSDDRSTTFNLSPRYKFDDNIMAYARVASGYRPGGSNLGYGPIPNYQPDTVVNYEAGIKAALPAQHLYIEASVFDIEWKDIQLQLRDSVGLTYVGNLGAARSRGLEAVVTWTPMFGLNLGLTGAYTKATLTKDILSGTAYGASGDRLPFSPAWKGTLSADYNFTVASHGAFVGASYLYSGSALGALAGDAATPRIRIPAYGTVDVRTGVNFDGYRVSLYVKNAFDKRGYNGANPLTLEATGATAISLIQPRTVGVSVNASF